MPRGLRRRRLAVGFVVGALVLGACGEGDSSKGVGLPTRTVEIGELEVEATPVRLDEDGADFTVVFDTHTGAPAIDVAAHARLSVDGRGWRDPTWSDDPAGSDGHHRRGTLRFDAAGPARGSARLTLGGLDRPLAMTWQLTP